MSRLVIQLNSVKIHYLELLDYNNVNHQGRELSGQLVSGLCNIEIVHWQCMYSNVRLFI